MTAMQSAELAEAIFEEGAAGRLCSRLSGEPDFHPISAVAGLLQDLPLDRATFFGRYAVDQQTMVEKAASLGATTSNSRLGALLTLVAVFGQAIEISSRYAEGGPAPTSDEVAQLERELSRWPGSKTLIRDLYHLNEHDLVSRHSHESLDWSSLQVHAIGTTSIVFRIRGVSGRELILKLSHVLFTTVGPILESTTRYFTDWGPLSARCPQIVRVWASGPGWVLQDYVDGITLREFIERGSTTDRQSPDYKAINAIYLPLIETLAEFHRIAGVGHGDLSPSNIMLSRVQQAIDEIPQWQIRFIDMGRNVLASTAIGRVSAGEASFVAPEVKAAAPDERMMPPSGDYFSLAKLLSYTAGFPKTDGFFGLDKRLYRSQPELARIAARLADVNPQTRIDYLRSFDSASSSSALTKLARYVGELNRLLRDADAEISHGSNGNLTVLVHAFTGRWTAVRTALGILTRIRRRRAVRDSLHLAPVVRTVVAAIALVLGIFILAYTGLVDLGWDPLELTSTLSALGYQPEKVAENWQVRLVAGSFFIAGFHYLIVAMGGITFWLTGVSWALRLLTELCLWLMATVVLVAVVCTVFVDPGSWVLWTAIGILVPAVNNLAMLAIRREIRRALGSDAVPVGKPGENHFASSDTLDVLQYWTPTLTLYACQLWFLAVVAARDELQDRLVWAATLCVVNIGVFSYSQCLRQGALVRSELAQYMIAAEILYPRRRRSRHS